MVLGHSPPKVNIGHTFICLKIYISEQIKVLAVKFSGSIGDYWLLISQLGCFGSESKPSYCPKMTEITATFVESNKYSAGAHNKQLNERTFLLSLRFAFFLM